MMIKLILPILLLSMVHLSCATVDIQGEPATVASVTPIEAPSSPTTLPAIEPEISLPPPSHTLEAFDESTEGNAGNEDAPDETSDEERLRAYLGGDDNHNVWDINGSLDEDNDEDEDIDRLLDYINNEELSGDIDFEEDNELPEQFDTTSSEDEEVVQKGIQSCLSEVENQLEPIINLSEALLDARVLVLKNDIAEVDNVETILMQQPDLIDDILRQTSTLLDECKNYKRKAIDAELNVSCLNPRDDNQMIVAHAIVDRISYGFGLSDYPTLVTYHDLMAICDSAILAEQYSQQQHDLEFESSVLENEAASPTVQVVG